MMLEGYCGQFLGVVRLYEETLTKYAISWCACPDQIRELTHMTTKKR
jgi:hypothetical protein